MKRRRFALAVNVRRFSFVWKIGHSFDDLAALSNITLELQTLSQTDSADEAQSWLFELPGMYYQQLAQENLILKTPIVASKATKEAPFSSSNIGWTSYATGEGFVLTGTGVTSISTNKGIIPATSIIEVNIEMNKEIHSHAA